MSNLPRSAVAAAILAGGMMSAQAGLVGSTVNLDWYSPDTSTLFCNGGAKTVDSSIEYNPVCSTIPVVVDFFDSTFTVQHNNVAFGSGSFNGFIVDVVTGADFSTVTYESGPLGVTSASVVNGDLYINFAGQQNADGATATFSFTQAGTAVPEPASLGMTGLALAALWLVRRRRSS